MEASLSLDPRQHVVVIVAIAISNRCTFRYFECIPMSAEFPKQEPSRSRELDEAYSVVLL